MQPACWRFRCRGGEVSGAPWFAVLMRVQCQRPAIDRARDGRRDRQDSVDTRTLGPHEYGGDLSAR
jgi:hypothetical protein